MSHMFKRISFFNKNLLLSCINILIIGIILTLVSYYIQGQVLEDNIKRQARGVATQSFHELALEDIQAVIHDHDLEGPLQKKLIRQLEELEEINENIAQAVIVHIDVNEKDESMALALPRKLIEGGVKPGDLVVQNPHFVKLYKEIKQSKQIRNSEVYSDQFGTWISVLIPVIDLNNEVIAMFVLDMDAALINNAQKDLLLLLIPSLAVLLSLIIIAQYWIQRRVLAPMRSIFDAIKQISNGNLNIKLNDKHQDELGILSKQINDMAVNIQEMMESIQQKAEQEAYLMYMKKQNKALEQYAQQVEKLTLVEERNRLAVELHDTIGHTIVSLVIGMDSVKSLMETDVAEAKNWLSSLLEMGRNSINEVRKHIHQIAFDAEETLIAHFNKVVNDFSTNTGVHVHTTYSGNEIETVPHVKLTLVRCLQELLTNAVKHGDASEIHVTLAFLESAIKLQVADNGNGSDDVALGFGLNAMRNKLQMLQGDIHIHSRAGQGFEVQCIIPVKR
ncbi:hypothetical protein PCURB6_16370 [Paenibacillus curdlanolyticus]|nr:hypothetical protein PCURB6_16370 [Paenibacillus curdlanolyticus]